MSVAGCIPAGLALPANDLKVVRVFKDFKDLNDLICWQSQTCPLAIRNEHCVVANPKTQCGARKYVELGENGTVGVGGKTNAGIQLSVY